MKKDIIPILNSKTYIANLSQEYDIRFCTINEEEELISFIKDNWKENHIFVLSRELFEWQHVDLVNNRINFVIAKEKTSGEIHSILGFVPTSQFDINIQHVEIWPCIWKVREDIHVKGLGISLYYYLKEHMSIETISILGISKIALSIYKSWDFETGKIETYYMLNDRIQKYHLVRCSEKKHYHQAVENNKKHLIYITEKEFMMLADEIQMPRYKSKSYYINRFYHHPLYSYEGYAVMLNNRCDAILFTRVCRHQGDAAIRIVDFLGEKESLIGTRAEWMSLLYKKKVEFIDFIVVGWQQQILEQAGFLKRDGDEIIIPNYFEPFELSNVELDYAYKTVSEDNEKIFYKADADQDRPNEMEPIG